MSSISADPATRPDPASEHFLAVQISKRTKAGLAKTLKGSVIMDVATPDRACIAEEAAAVPAADQDAMPSDCR